jgi:hypothetical protein
VCRCVHECECGVEDVRLQVSRVKWVRVREGVSVVVVTWGPRSVCQRERASWAFVNVGAPAADED